MLASGPHNVPWHRVVRADGSVTQGRRQLQRLRKEGVPIKGNRVDMLDARLPPELVALGRRKQYRRR